MAVPHLWSAKPSVPHVGGNFSGLLFLEGPSFRSPGRLKEHALIAWVFCDCADEKPNTALLPADRRLLTNVRLPREVICCSAANRLCDLELPGQHQSHLPVSSLTFSVLVVVAPGYTKNWKGVFFTFCRTSDCGLNSTTETAFPRRLGQRFS